MIADVRPPLGVWFDLYAATGLPNGSRLVIINKGGGPALVWEGATAPSNKTDGYPLKPGDPPIVTGSGNGVWVLHYIDGYTGFGQLSVQAYTP